MFTKTKNENKKQKPESRCGFICGKYDPLSKMLLCRQDFRPAHHISKMNKSCVGVEKGKQAG